MLRNRKLLLFINRAIYIVAAAMLVAGVVLTVAPQSASAQQTGSAWTTDEGCGTQNKNHYAIGEQIWIRWASLKADSYGYTIIKTNQPDKGWVAASGTINVTANGCIWAHTVLTTDPMGEYKFEFFPTAAPNRKIKSDNLTFTASIVPTLPPTEEPTLPPTEEPTLPPTEEPTLPPTEEPTLPPTEEPTLPPTEEPTLPPTEEPTLPPTEEPTLPPTEEPTLPPTQEPTDPPTQEPTDPPATQEPTQDPTEDPTQNPTGGPDDPEPTSQPKQYNPPAVASASVLIPVTGIDDASGLNDLSFGGFGLLGLGLVMTGIRRKYNL